GRKREIQKELSFFDPGPRLGEKVKEISRIDGLKYIFQDHSWLMIRPSGTEHVVRIYAEASSEERLRNLMEVGLDFVRG
ncbi:phosphomannomutase / phosphoglucomutase, partial [Candidatus Hakubella thermalkaliphila]